MAAPVLATTRLIMRPWRDEDLAPFAQLNADSEVMEHFPRLLTRAESDVAAERYRLGLLQNPFGFWALEVPGIAGFIGFAGLQRPSFEAPFTPCVEIGWRLAREFWGHGYATEAAAAALDHGFNAAGLEEIVSFTVPDNRRSRSVMERLGMHRDPAGDFDHPLVPEGDPLRRHVLYRIGAQEWRMKKRGDPQKAALENS